MQNHLLCCVAGAGLALGIITAANDVQARTIIITGKDRPSCCYPYIKNKTYRRRYCGTRYYYPTRNRFGYYPKQGLSTRLPGVSFVVRR